MSQSLKNQIANLQRKLAKVNVSPNNATTASSGASKSKRRKNRRNNSARSSGNIVAPRTFNANPATRNPKGISANGTIRIKKREFLGDVKQGKDLFFTITPQSIPWLSGIDKIFDRHKWHSCVFTWVPSVGTTTDGSIIAGFDWDSFSKAVVSASHVASCMPVRSTPLWQGFTMALPSSKLMSRKWLQSARDVKADEADTCIGYLLYHTSGAPGSDDKSAGQFWIEYDITFTGTTN